MVTPQLPLFMTSASHPAIVVPIRVLPSCISASPGPSLPGPLPPPAKPLLLLPEWNTSRSFQSPPLNSNVLTTRCPLWFLTSLPAEVPLPLVPLPPFTHPSTHGLPHPQPHHPLIQSSDPPLPQPLLSIVCVPTVNINKAWLLPLGSSQPIGRGRRGTRWVNAHPAVCGARIR